MQRAGAKTDACSRWRSLPPPQGYRPKSLSCRWFAYQLVLMRTVLGVYIEVMSSICCCRCAEHFMFAPESASRNLLSLASGINYTRAIMDGFLAVGFVASIAAPHDTALLSMNAIESFPGSSR
jgi:hypothetical protein